MQLQLAKGKAIWKRSQFLQLNQRCVVTELRRTMHRRIDNRKGARPSTTC